MDAQKVDNSKEVDTAASSEVNTEISSRESISEGQTPQGDGQKKFVLTHDYIHQSK